MPVWACLAALAVLVPLVMFGCSKSSPVGPLQFQGSVNDQTYATSRSVTLVLPAASGGNGPLNYSLRPMIPGLTFDADERTLSGTPTEAGTHRMTYMVMDGRTNAVRTFTITIEQATPGGLTSRYRGRGDQVFALNPEGENLDDEFYTLDLGGASAEVYLIATNTAGYDMKPYIERLDLREAAAKGLRTAVGDDRVAQPRPAASARVPEREWITEFNNTRPFRERLAQGSGRLRMPSHSEKSPRGTGSTTKTRTMMETSSPFRHRP